jgi:uncharacterized membrane protein
MDSNTVSRASSACAGLVSLFGFLAPGSALAAFSDPFYQSSFQSPDTIGDWTITSGDWRFANGELRSSTGALNVATVHTYDAAQFPHDTIGRNLSLDVYAWIASSAANARAGAVFDFADADNYHEVTVSATGSVQLRSRIGGLSRTVASAAVAAPGANQWIHIRFVRSSERTTVWIDGVRAFDNVNQGGLPAGDAGLIARNAHARFDDIDIRNFGRQDPYREDFGDGLANGWRPLSGTWSAASKIYTSTAVVATAITQSPLARVFDVGRAASDLAYTFKVRMLNPYGGSGNLVGVAWVRNAGDYTEAVFSPTGQARLNKIANGVRTTLASASYLGGSRNTWFEVEIGSDSNDPHEVTYIKVNGVPVFDVAPNVRQGNLSLITHWAPGQFDNVRAATHFLSPFIENFDDGTAPQFAPTGTWNLQDDMLSSTAIVQESRAFVQKAAGWHELADIEFRARMINRFGSSGNLVGFTYGARGPVYYEAVFSPTGVAHLRKVVKNVTTPIATARYEGGEQGQWFDAQLIQQGERTTVKVNGITVFDNVLQPDAIGGELGFVGHWTSASVDEVLFAQIPVTRYRFRELPDIVEQFETLTSIRALNDRGEAVGLSRNLDAKQTAVLWRDEGVIDLGVTAFLGVVAASNGTVAQGINNKSEIVGTASGIFTPASFYWNEGQLRNLGSPTSARDINERGQIAGSSCGAVANNCPALLWEPDGRVVSLQDLPGGFSIGDGWANNDRGEIVGNSWGSANVAEAVSWQGGVVEPLGAEGTAFDINNRGQIVGVARVDERRAVIWQERELIVLPSRVGEVLSLLRDFSAALAINEHGVVVGRATVAPPSQSGATLWQEGRAVDLNEVLCSPLPRSMSLTTAVDINERGEIAADAFDSGNTQSRAFVLTPVLGDEGCDR